MIKYKFSVVVCLMLAVILFKADCMSQQRQFDLKTPTVTPKMAPFCLTLSITSTSPLPSTVVGADYTCQIHTSGGKPPITFRWEPNGEIRGDKSVNLLPYGLTLSKTGLISGQLVKVWYGVTSYYPPGYYNFIVVAEDSCETGRQRVRKIFYLLVNPK